VPSCKAVEQKLARMKPIALNELQFLEARRRPSRCDSIFSMIPNMAILFALHGDSVPIIEKLETPHRRVLDPDSGMIVA
jgi:hypothetical protein